MVAHREVHDDSLSTLVGLVVPSPFYAQVSYCISRTIASGGCATAFLASRRHLDQATPVVLKVVHPSTLGTSESTAELSVMKEVVALGRLNERVPPTPYVVRLFDSGAIDVLFEGRPNSLPWLAIEYVHGGVEGTTLEERIEFSARETKYAFDPNRTALAVEAVTRGLSAVHEAGVVHRDITLCNVLCSGFGEGELFKIADFGLARPSGMEGTFGKLSIGTPGYAAPEQTFGDKNQVGPWTDVFGMACVVYAMLTKEDYFLGNNDVTTMMSQQKPERRSITESAFLCPELRERHSDCKAIDKALARATALAVEERPQSPAALEDMLVSHLRERSRRSMASGRHVDSVIASTPMPGNERWVFTECHRGTPERVVRVAAWDGRNRCLVAVSKGLEFWDGAEWHKVPMKGLPDQGIEFVQRLPQGDWLVAGDGVLARLGIGGIVEKLSVPAEEERFEITDGDLDDLGVVVATRRTGPPVLHAKVGGRWLKPFVADGVVSIAAVARIAEERWLVVGRTADEKGFAAQYAPLLWELRMLKTFSGRAMLACAAQRHRKLALLAGTDGAVARIDDGRVSVVQVSEAADFSAAAIDMRGRLWLGAPGQLWSNTGEHWSPLWQAEGAPTPVRSIFAEDGLVILMTADGRIIEGRAE